MEELPSSCLLSICSGEMESRTCSYMMRLKYFFYNSENSENHTLGCGTYILQLREVFSTEMP